MVIIGSKVKKILLIISRMFLFLLIVGGIISAFLLFQERNLIYNLSGIITFAILGITALFLLFLCLLQKQPKQQIQQTTIFYFLTLFLLLLFLALFISSYGLYSLWFFLFKFLSPVYLIGLVFIFALIMTFFLKDLGYTISFCVPVLLYPFIFLNHAKTELALGAILGGIILGNIIVTYFQYDFSKLNIKRSFIKKIFIGNFKIFLLTFLVSLILFFLLGKDHYVLFSSNIHFNKTTLLINLLGFFLLFLFLLFQIKPVFIFTICVIVQTITGFILQLFAIESQYNVISFLLFSHHETLINVSLYLYSYCCATVWFGILLVLASFKAMYGQFMSNVILFYQLDKKFMTIGMVFNYEYKYLFYYKSWIDLLTYRYQQNTITVWLTSNDIVVNHRLVQTIILYQLHYQIMQMFLPFSIHLLWTLFWTSNNFNIVMLRSYLLFLKSAWVYYFLLALLTFFIIFPGGQDYFFHNWWEGLTYRIKLKQCSLTKCIKGSRIRKKWKQNKKK
ncbi:hypothetical protein SMIPMB4A_v3c8720 [Spiroplasma melliferum IPMB4A]|uniref:Transmembrane protein n=3 Tax=Spiroplasma melliferum TaxID=2134 RepID=A0AAI9X0U5_SPIME|nr:hypothetical protein [Spiroplasma melliferum]ELL44143.1 hypothetical protein SMIPMB4A_v3c8720 [Spiroplasma melliferum IPMB4A]KAI92275.1 hypothetical protein SPM_006010 [Spiroplasma melliferum KC3]QCO23702.1 hypothetical protein SRED_002173 [Spiroplasma melliferum]